MPALPTSALLALSPLSPRGSVLPPLTAALPWAEALHEALVKLSDDGERGSPSCLTGRDGASGDPLTGHRHASVLPLALGGEGQLDHVLVHAPMAFDRRAREALARVARVWIAPGGATLRVELPALGLREELAGRLPALRAATAWASITPFVPARHLKARGSGALEEQVQAELASRGLPRATSVEVEIGGGGYALAAGFWALWRSEEALDGRMPPARWKHFQVERRDAERRPPVRVGLGLRLRFGEPLLGPLALGYASHFGLGQLWPA